MPCFESSQDWIKQSELLIQAHPRTARITSKYTIEATRPAGPRKRKRKGDGLSGEAEPMALQTDDGAGAGGGGEARASLTLRTYDPVSGSCLKYGTDKVTELGRIVAGLGKLAGYMAALPVAAKATTDEGAERVGVERVGVERAVVGRAGVEKAGVERAGVAAAGSEAAASPVVEPVAGRPGLKTGGGGGGGGTSNSGSNGKKKKKVKK